MERKIHYVFSADFWFFFQSHPWRIVARLRVTAHIQSGLNDFSLWKMEYVAGQVSCFLEVTFYCTVLFVIKLYYGLRT